MTDRTDEAIKTDRRLRSPAEHCRLAEELLDLANEHMRQRDAATHRWGRRQRRIERRRLENATYILGVAQVHATLAGATDD
jgi:hypothetical protein